MAQLLIHHLIHRCRGCGKTFSAPGDRELPTCLCGGMFAVDAAYHPDVPGAFTFVRPPDSPRCDHCGAMHATVDCTLADLEDVRAACDAARQPAPEPYSPHNGHAYGNIALGATGT